MANLVTAAAVFVAIHLFVSGTRLRDALTARIGQGPYMGLFSLASIGVLTWTGFAYAAARTDPSNSVFWASTPATRAIQLALALLAFIFIVAGLLTPNPTSVRQEGALERENVAQGMLRITRHPFLWGVALWAAGHLLVNGDTASLVLFGSMLLLAVFGTYSIDAKRKRGFGEAWDTFAAKTSNIPFAAIAAGRQRLAVGEIGWRLAVALLIWAGLAYSHRWIFGVPALP